MDKVAVTLEMRRPAPPEILELLKGSDKPAEQALSELLSRPPTSSKVEEEVMTHKEADSRDPLEDQYDLLLFDEVEHEWGYSDGIDTEPETDSGKMGDGRMYACSMAQGYRNYMEDRVLTPSPLDDGSQIFGLFDGHGGTMVAGYVQDNLRDAYTATLVESGDPATALAAAFVKLDTDLLDEENVKVKFARRYFRDLAHNEERREKYRIHMYHEHGKKPRFERTVFEDYSHLSDERIVEKFERKMRPWTNNIRSCGTTAVACVLKGDSLVVANAGDSRAILIRDGKPLQLTVDHKPKVPEEKERIFRAGCKVWEGRVDGDLNISRAIGDHAHKRKEKVPRAEQSLIADPHVYSTTVQAGDSYLVLISDGIYDAMENDKLVDFIVAMLSQKEGSELELHHCAEAIIKECIEWRGEKDKRKLSKDNVSVLLVKLNGFQ